MTLASMIAPELVGDAVTGGNNAGPVKDTGGRLSHEEIRRRLGAAVQGEGAPQYTVNPNAGPEQGQAALTRAQWDYFKEFYRPLEEQVLAEAMRTNFSEEADTAGGLASAASRTARGTLARNIRRSTGGSLSAEERRAVDRRSSIARTSDVARAENTTRRSLADSRQSMLADAIGIGRGVQQTASSGLASAANMATSRELQYQQQQAAYQNQMMQGLGSAAALAIFAM